jgi:hypothetical protein
MYVGYMATSYISPSSLALSTIYVMVGTSSKALKSNTVAEPYIQLRGGLLHQFNHRRWEER